MDEAAVSAGRGRNRKQTTFFEVAANVEAKKVEVVEGNGIKLSENPHFCKELEKIKADSDVCKALHSIMYNSVGRKAEIKKNLRSFSGFSSEASADERKAKTSEKKKQWTVSVLKSSLGMLGLERSGDRDVLINRLVAYLAAPHFTKDASAASVGTKRKASGKKTKSGKGKRSKKSASGEKKKKSAPSAYILYCASQRAALREAQPELSMIEQTKVLGAQWNALDAETKEVRSA